MNGKHFFGMVLMLIGVLITVLAGGCTLFGFAINPLLAVAVGAIPISIGIAIVRWGKKLSQIEPLDVNEPWPKETEVLSSQSDVDKMNKDIE